MSSKHKKVIQAIAAQLLFISYHVYAILIWKFSILLAKCIWIYRHILKMSCVLFYTFQTVVFLMFYVYVVAKKLCNFCCSFIWKLWKTHTLFRPVCVWLFMLLLSTFLPCWYLVKVLFIIFVRFANYKL